MTSSHKTLVKSIDNFKLQGELESQPSAPPVHVVSKAIKIRKPHKPLVFKSSTLNPSYMSFYRSLGLNPDQDFLKARAEQGPKQLYIDTVLCDYVSFMNGTANKSRMVVDEKTATTRGKTATFIPGLKTFGNLFADLTAEMKSIAETKSDASKTEQSLSVLAKLLQTSPDKKRTLMTFARCCVFIKRLDVSDLHANNIGIDQFGNVVLFDLEHGFSQIQTDKYPNIEAIAKKNLSDKDLLLPAHNLLCTMFQLKSISYDELAKSLGNNAGFFLKCIYKAWLQEALYPSTFIERLFAAHETPEVKDLTSDYVNFMKFSQSHLLDLLQKNKEFVAFLLKEGNAAVEEIVEHFKAAQKNHKHYFRNADYFSKMFLFNIAMNYILLIEKIQNQKIYAFIDPIISAKEPDSAKIILNLKTTFPAETKAEAPKEQRSQALKEACQAFLFITQHPSYDTKAPYHKKIMAAFTKNPNYLYKMLLSALYTNNKTAVKTLLPEYLSLKDVDVNGVDEFGKTLLHHTIDTYSLYAAEILLKKGARADSKAGAGKPVGLSLLLMGEVSIIMHLMDKYPKQIEAILSSQFCGISFSEFQTFSEKVAGMIAAKHTDTSTSFDPKSQEDMDCLTYIGFFHRPRLNAHTMRQFHLDSLNSVELKEAKKQFQNLGR